MGKKVVSWFAKFCSFLNGYFQIAHLKSQMSPRDFSASDMLAVA